MLYPNDKSAAKRNTQAMTAALGIRGARLVDLQAGAYSFYFDGTSTDRPINGSGRIASRGTFGVGGYPSNHVSAGPIPRFVQLGKGPILRLSGAGFIVDDPIEWVGDGESAAIEVEGRATVPSGRHRFRNQIFTNCAAWFKTLATPDEAHSDMSLVDGCEGYNCDRALWLCNQQSMGWKLRDCAVNVLGDKNCIVADIERGGWVTLDGLILNHPRVTLFRLRDYSPNNCRLICRDFYRDRPTTDDNYLTLVDYVGPKNAVSWSIWSLIWTGFLAPQDTPLDLSKVYCGCDGLPRDKWHIGVEGL